MTKTNLKYDSLTKQSPAVHRIAHTSVFYMELNMIIKIAIVVFGQSCEKSNFYLKSILTKINITFNFFLTNM